LRDARGDQGPGRRAGRLQIIAPFGADAERPQVCSKETT
jgi:hypothetical protein